MLENIILDEKQEKVKEILLTPIITSKSFQGISLATTEQERGKEYKFILSGQKYEGMTDEDMSDIAIEFYKMIYGIDILDKETGKLINKQFAGDTMNSYRQIARRKGLSEEKRIAWCKSYHCLANFWILPMDIGRKAIKGISKSQVSKDYMDGFLTVLSEKYGEYSKIYPEYFPQEGIKKFYINQHLNECGYIKKDVIEKITGLEPNEVINRMAELVEKRAEYLSVRYTEKLYNYFEKIKLIN